MAGVGRLTEIISVDQETTNADDEDAPTFLEIGRLRAEVKPLRATEAERANAVRTVSVYQFTVLARAAAAIGVTPQHRIRWGSLEFNVREVRTPPPQVPFLDIIAETGVPL